MSNRKVVITNGNGEEVKTVEIKNNEVDITLDDSDGCVLTNPIMMIDSFLIEQPDADFEMI